MKPDEVEKVGVIGCGIMGSGIAANPYLQFYTVAEQSGEIEFSWIDDTGATGRERVLISVSG